MHMVHYLYNPNVRITNPLSELVYVLKYFVIAVG